MPAVNLHRTVAIVYYAHINGRVAQVVSGWTSTGTTLNLVLRGFPSHSKIRPPGVAPWLYRNLGTLQCKHGRPQGGGKGGGSFQKFGKKSIKN